MWSVRTFGSYWCFLVLCCGLSGELAFGRGYGHADARFEGIRYFAITGPDTIERYHVRNGTWLAPIPLGGPIRDIEVDQHGIFVAPGSTVAKLEVDGSHPRSFTMEATVRDLFSVGKNGEFLVAVDSDSRYTTVRKADFSVVEQGFLRMFWIEVGPDGFRAYGNHRDAGIGVATFGEDGTLESTIDDGLGFGLVTRRPMSIFPDGTKVVLRDGLVLATADLSPVTQWETNVSEVHYIEDVTPLVLYNHALAAYSSGLVLTDGVLLEESGTHLEIVDATALVFHADSSEPTGMGIIEIPLTEWEISTDDIDPLTAIWNADETFIDGEGILNLWSKAQGMIFRWSIEDQQYLDPITIGGTATDIAFSSELGLLFTAHGDGTIKKLSPLDGGAASELPFASTSGPLRGMFPHRRNLMVIGESATIFNESGEVVSTTGDPVVRGFRWLPARELLVVDHSTSEPVFRLGEDGHLRPAEDSVIDTRSIRLEWLSPDNHVYLNDQGGLRDTHSGEYLDFVEIEPQSVLWLDSQNYLAMVPDGARTRLELWSGPPLKRTDRWYLDGTPSGIARSDGQILAVTSLDGRPRIAAFDKDNMSMVSVSPARPMPPVALRLVQHSHDSIEIGWEDGSDNSDDFLLQTRRVDESTWSQPVAAAYDLHQGFTITGLEPGTSYEIRIFSKNAHGHSDPSEILITNTRSGPNAPIADPYQLRVDRAFPDSVHLLWQDNTDSETGFRIYRSIGAIQPLQFWETFEVPAGTTSWIDESVTTGRYHYYRVLAFNGFADGELSEIVEVFPPTQIGQLLPSELEVSAGPARTAILEWEDNNTHEDGFIVLRSEELRTIDSGIEIARVPYNVTSFVDEGPLSGDTYYYAVHPYNAFGENKSINGRPVTFTDPESTFGGLSARHDGIQYFHHHSPERLLRYEFQSGQWLQPVPLWASPTALHVDDGGIYVARAGSLVRVEESGAETTLSASGALERILGLDENFLVGRDGGKLTTYPRSGGPAVGSLGRSFVDSVAFSVIPGTGRVFAEDPSEGNARGLLYRFSADGQRVPADDSAAGELLEGQFQLDVPEADRSWAYPDGSRIIDDNGNVFDTSSLRRIASIDGPIRDVVFIGDLAITLLDDSIRAYGPALAYAGHIELNHQGSHLAVTEQELFVFRKDPTFERDWLIEIHSRAALPLPPPTNLESPSGLAFDVDHSFVDSRGTVFLHSRSYRRLFRWDPVSPGYQTGIPLEGVATDVVYAPDSDRIFVLYEDGRINQIDPAAPVPAEAPFVVTDQLLEALESAGSFLAAGGRRLLIFAANGELQSIDPSAADTDVLHWDALEEKLYSHEHGFLLTSRVLGRDGQLEQSESRHFLRDQVLGSIWGPPEGGELLLPSGLLVRSNSATSSFEFLPADIFAADWMNGVMATLRPSGEANSKVELQLDEPGIRNAVAIAGLPLGLHALPDDRWLAITSVDGEPTFSVLDRDLNPAAGPVGSLPPTAAFESLGLRVEWGGDLRLLPDVNLSGSATFTWQRDGEPLEDQHGPELLLDGARFEDAGRYSVVVSNGHGSVSQHFDVVVGRPAGSGLTPGTLLVDRGFDFRQYSASGTLLGTLSIGNPTEAARSGHIAIDEQGNILRLNGINEEIPRLSVLDPYTQTANAEFLPWSPTYAAPGGADIALISGRVFTSGAAFDLDSRTVFEGWAPAEEVLALTSGPNGRLFGSVAHEVLSLNPDSGDILERRTFEAGTGIPDLELTAGGDLALATTGSRIQLYGSDGALLESRSIFRKVVDMAASPQGLLAVSWEDRLWILDDTWNLIAELSNVRSTNIAWVPHFISFDTEPLEAPLAEDSEYSYQANFFHSDPTAELHVSGSFPEWMQLEELGNGIVRLSGVPPTDEDAGWHKIELKAVAEGLQPLTQSYQVLVEAVNDIPVGPPSIDLVIEEDSGISLIDLASLVLDEEDADLDFSISETQEGLLHADLVGSTLSVRPEADANGIWRARIEATDDNGASVILPLSVEISPVPDAPVALEHPLIDVGASGADILLPLATLFSDADPGDELSYEVAGGGGASIFDAVEITTAPHVLLVRFADYVSGESAIEIRAVDTDGLEASAFVTFRLPVIPAPQLVAHGEPALNRQTGLFEQVLTVTNTGQRAIGGFDVQISGLPAGVALWAAGEQSLGTSSINYNLPLAAGESAQLTLEYFSTQRAPFAIDYEVGHTLPTDLRLVNTPLSSIDRIVALPDGSMLLEFDAVAGERYTVHYQDAGMGGWAAAGAAFIAGGDRVQWLDRGPPKTGIKPSDARSRMYRVSRGEADLP